MAFVLSGRIGVDLDTTPTTLDWKLGDEQLASDGATYKYVQANGAIAANACVKIDDTNEILELTTAISGAEPTWVGVAPVAFADNDYGWVIISGPCTVLAAASCAADVVLETTATAGVIDDTAGGGDDINGIKLTTANGGTQAAVAAFIAGRATTNTYG